MSVDDRVFARYEHLVADFEEDRGRMPNQGESIELWKAAEEHVQDAIEARADMMRKEQSYE